jgi:hypothetical protein
MGDTTIGEIMKSIWLPLDILCAERVVAPDGSVWLHALVADEKQQTDAVAAVDGASATTPAKCVINGKPCHTWLGHEEVDGVVTEVSK